MVESVFVQVFEVVGKGTQAVRGLVEGLAPEYLSLILLGLSLAAMWYASQKYPNVIGRHVFVLYGILLFLVLRFV